jgi:hypothetical protein
VIEVTETTLNASTSPAVIVVVHPVKVISTDLVAESGIVGSAEAQIESATVGGKLAYVSFQISKTVDPV